MGKFSPLTYSEWDHHLKLKAERELNEKDDQITSEIKQLKKMIKEHNVQCCMEDDFLIWFLRGRKHDIERSFETIKLYADFRRNEMKLYGFSFFELIRKPLEQGVCGLLPKRDDQGRAIIFIRPSMWIPGSCDSLDITRLTGLLSHFALSYPATQVNGFSAIFDCTAPSMNIIIDSMKYVRVYAPSYKTFPGRFQQVSIVNANAFVRGIGAVVLAILPSKLRKRATFYGDAKEALPKIYHPSILPEEFGGTMGTLNEINKEWLEDFKKFVIQFQATNTFYKGENSSDYPETEEEWITMQNTSPS